MARFDEGSLAVGLPLALLEEVFATVCSRHRCPLQATVKIDRFLERVAARGATAVPDLAPPPGSPIGSAALGRLLSDLRLQLGAGAAGTARPSTRG